jgi:hypothetical protein
MNTGEGIGILTGGTLGHPFIALTRIGLDRGRLVVRIRSPVPVDDVAGRRAFRHCGGSIRGRTYGLDLLNRCAFDHLACEDRAEMIELLGACATESVAENIDGTVRLTELTVGLGKNNVAGDMMRVVDQPSFAHLDGLPEHPHTHQLLGIDREELARPGGPGASVGLRHCHASKLQIREGECKERSYEKK